jgi:pyruvate kinase
MNYKRTKIVATMGPASSDKAVISKMMDAGMNVCRVNFSHGSYEDHAAIIKRIRELNEEKKHYTAILADLQGPKLRVGKMKENTVLEDGSELVITTVKCEGDAQKFYISYPSFPQDVKAGETVLLDDGNLVLEVVKSNGKDEVIMRVVHGGVLSSNKGVNLPNTKISLPCLTEKDLEDLDFALEQDFDWIGLSFVRSARDIIELKHIIQAKGKTAKVIAKIEKPEAVDDIKEIVKVADGIMVARGDLGVEIPMQNVPLTQKMIVNLCLKHAKPVIIATQMMESMINNITPTRAEVNDVANAVLDGADAVMLSGETSVGKFPVEVIKNMTKIALEIEKTDRVYYHETEPEKNQKRFITDSICFNATRLANRVDAKAIVNMTHSGYTAFKTSSQRPKARIFVFTANKRIMTTLSLVWGVECLHYDKMVSTDHTVADIKYILKKEGYLNEGDLIINTASMPIEDGGMTNMLKLSYI